MTGDAASDVATLLAELDARSDPRNVEGMARFGISAEGTLGISVTDLRAVAREALRGRAGQGAWRHDLAGGLWASGLHEARILAALTEDPAFVTRAQAEAWAGDLDSWDVCDLLCANLLDRTPMAYELAAEWAGSEEEFVKRAGFALMAALASHDKDAADARFAPFLELVEREADDDRNFVKKAVNWALRQIGKRSAGLNAAASATAGRIRDRSSSRAARWIATDALRELTSDSTRQRLGMAGPPR